MRCRKAEYNRLQRWGRFSTREFTRRWKWWTQRCPDQHVVDELQRGYKYKDRLLRPAMVRVARNGGIEQAGFGSARYATQRRTDMMLQGPAVPDSLNLIA